MAVDVPNSSGWFNCCIWTCKDQAGSLWQSNTQQFRATWCMTLYIQADVASLSRRTYKMGYIALNSTIDTNSGVWDFHGMFQSIFYPKVSNSCVLFFCLSVWHYAPSKQWAMIDYSKLRDAIQCPFHCRRFSPMLRSKPDEMIICERPKGRTLKV